MTLQGTAELEAKLRRISARTKNAFGNAMRQEVLIEQAESMSRTPVDTGALRASHETSEPRYLGDEIEIDLTVGGPAAPYAASVHYDLDSFHPNGGQALFLESTWIESAPFMGGRVAARVIATRWADV